MTQYPRETNPPAKQNPAVSPFYFDANGNPKKMGENNPLPSKLYAEDENGNKVPVKVDANGNLTTQLTGRNVEKIMLFDTLAITDTTSKNINVDLSKYKEIHVWGKSTLDQPVDMYYFKDNSIVETYDDGTDTWKVVYYTDLKATLTNGRMRYINTYFSEFNQLASDELTFMLKCSAAPTSGSVTLYVLGVLN